MKVKFKDRLWNRTPSFLKNYITAKIIIPKQGKNEILTLRKVQADHLKALRLKDKINVIFLVIHDSIWKYEEVYRQMEKNEKFNISIVICPLVRDGEGQMDVYYQSLSFFENKNYKVVGTFDNKTKEWIDIKYILKPDIVFFTNPHKLTFDQYYIQHFKELLTIYTPYAYVVIHSIYMHYGQDFHSIVWRHFVETKHHLKFARSYLKSYNKNTIVSGFPGLDETFRKNYSPSNPWKKVNRLTKKIIWAPHHTIAGQDNGLNYSSFMELAHFLLDFVKSSDNFQVAFKPHPLLKEKLYNDKGWGEEKTNSYYKEWNMQSNSQLEEGPYIDLFYHSDAMIMDSASFIVEYLYFDKPIMFTMKDELLKSRFNSFGQKVFNFLYQGRSPKDIVNFLNSVVLNQKDTLSEKRSVFFKNNILPKGSRTASERIYNHIVKEIDK